MKIIRLLVLSLSFLPGGISWAGLGHHDTTSISKNLEGACAECHNTSAQGATRGWGLSTVGAPTTGWFAQPITTLCWSCHGPGSGMGAHDVSVTAMSDFNHRYLGANAPPGAADPKTRDIAGSSASGLPYAATGSLQCTSCHNVHSDQNRPFLAKTDMVALCSSCHPRRSTTTIRAANVGGGDGVSLHPVNVAMADMTGGSVGIKPISAMDNALKTPLTLPDNTWRLGGKLSGGDAGNITCATCHAVHGPAGGGSGINDLLAIDNRSGDTTAPNNPLCGGCHTGGFAGGFVGAAAAADHPVDNNQGRTTFYPTGVAIPVTWTILDTPPRLDRGAAVFSIAGVQGTPRCSTCHDAHGGAGGTSLLRSPTPAGAGGEWCFSCHVVSLIAPSAHHSVKGVEGGQFTSSITCGSCHARGLGGHNGFYASFVDNASAFTTVRGRSVSVADVSANKESALCLYCHRDDDPLNWRAVYGHADNAAMMATMPPGMPAAHGTKRGGGSHYLGVLTVPAWGVTLKDTSWALDNAAFSKYGGGTTGGGGVAPVLIPGVSSVICESCHNVLYNDAAVHPLLTKYSNRTTSGWAFNLLLEPYEDDLPGIGQAGALVGSSLCTGCHGMVGNHHVMTWDILTTLPPPLPPVDHGGREPRGPDERPHRRRRRPGDALLSGGGRDGLRLLPPPPFRRLPVHRAPGHRPVGQDHADAAGEPAPRSGQDGERLGILALPGVSLEVTPARTESRIWPKRCDR